MSGYLSTQRDRALRLQCRHAAKRSHHSFEWFTHTGASIFRRLATTLQRQLDYLSAVAEQPPGVVDGSLSASIDSD